LSACDACLRRAALLAALAPWIARALDEHRRLPELLSLDDDELVEAVCGRRRAIVDRTIAHFDAGTAREAAAEAGLTSTCRHRPRFPERLLEARDAPFALYVLGAEERLERLSHEPPVAIVGARRGSLYGLEVARSLARELAACRIPVVSGMALGIDSAAHEGALEAGGFTVAVLAGSADYAYPRAKARLHRRIAANGLAVSELPPGARPFRWCFPARNRIMAGLAEMTLVVEGAAGSGSLITARFAQDLGRELGAVPGQITTALACGPNDLLADGACVVRSASDVLDVLFGVGAGPRPDDAASRPALEPRLERLLAAIERGAASADAIASSSAEVAEVLAGLTELELLGLVRRGAGGSYVRSA
jgi:DNA processing protein